MGVFGALSVFMALTIAFGLLSSQSAATHAAGVSLTPRFMQMKSHLSANRFAGTPLKTWSSSFTYSGKNYPYTMVGTNPSNGSATTTIPTIIVPLKVVFSGGSSLNGSQKLTLVKNSPLYQNASYSSGTTQYADAMQRAEFWKTVSSKAANYHVLLGAATVTATVTIKVPAADGFTEHAGSNNTLIGLADVNWFDGQIQAQLSKFNIAPNNFPIFLSNNVYLYQGSSSNCCILGYHSAVSTSQGNQTYAWGSYISPGLFSAGVQDIDGLSHEVAEWMNDPYVNNTVPNWSVPSEPQYGCSSVLEVGDPLVGTAFKVKIGTTTYHPQDIAFFSWFARQSPSIGINGRYTYLGTFTTYSPSC
ncbi:MAG TPA: hypothetical protein VFQ30_14335 [Ktedonobacteraceae bacterium]|nr:hypothetical protein [Ktedonobacteraceae bacterium]